MPSCRCADAEYYWAEITAYNKETGKHKVKYADRFTEDLHLPVEKLDWGQQKPTIAFNPAECGFATLHDVEAQRAASGLQTIARSRSAPAATLRSYASNYAAGLLHQVRETVTMIHSNENFANSRCGSSVARLGDLKQVLVNHETLSYVINAFITCQDNELPDRLRMQAHATMRRRGRRRWRRARQSSCRDPSPSGTAHRPVPAGIECSSGHGHVRLCSLLPFGLNAVAERSAVFAWQHCDSKC